MTKSHLLWIGRENKKTAEDQLCAHYLERVRLFTPITQKCLRPATEKTRDISVAVQKEGERLLKELAPGDFLIICDERGRQLSSPELARMVEKRELAATKRMVWVIGGAMGLDNRVRERADFMLSLSKMTLPHALARIVLLEQIYRAFCIRQNHPYHHEG